MELSITKQGGKEEAIELFNKALAILDGESVNWYGDVTISFKAFFSPDTYQKKT